MNLFAFLCSYFVRCDTKRENKPLAAAVDIKAWIAITGWENSGASEGIRTLDNHLGKVELYQLSYARLSQNMPV